MLSVNSEVSRRRGGRLGRKNWKSVETLYLMQAIYDSLQSSNTGCLQRWSDIHNGYLRYTRDLSVQDNLLGEDEECYTRGKVECTRRYENLCTQGRKLVYYKDIHVITEDGTVLLIYLPWVSAVQRIVTSDAHNNYTIHMNSLNMKAAHNMPKNATQSDQYEIALCLSAVAKGTKEDGLSLVSPFLLTCIKSILSVWIQNEEQIAKGLVVENVTLDENTINMKVQLNTLNPESVTSSLNSPIFSTTSTVDSPPVTPMPVSKHVISLKRSLSTESIIMNKPNTEQMHSNVNNTDCQSHPTIKKRRLSLPPLTSTNFNRCTYHALQQPPRSAVLQMSAITAFYVQSARMPAAMGQFVLSACSTCGQNIVVNQNAVKEKCLQCVTDSLCTACPTNPTSDGSYNDQK